MTETIYFAAGCFWGVEESFRKLVGVIETEVGYIGGHTDKPSYETVCSHNTGHAEAVKVVFDNDKVNLLDLLSLFWKIHDPTTLNRQGPDVGSQYRSAIFYTTPIQKESAESSRDVLEKSHKYSSPIVTEILEAPTFWSAEEYHQKYFMKNGGGTCHI